MTAPPMPNEQQKRGLRLAANGTSHEVIISALTVRRMMGRACAERKIAAWVAAGWLCPCGAGYQLTTIGAYIVLADSARRALAWWPRGLGPVRVAALGPATPADTFISPGAAKSLLSVGAIECEKRRATLTDRGRRLRAYIFAECDIPQPPTPELGMMEP